MSKIERNDPCFCGSGVKFKKCCIGKPSQMTAAHEKEQAEARKAYAESLELDNLSNSVVTLIKTGNIDLAQDACNQLMERYPSQADYLHRFAEVYEARGDVARALEFLHKTAEFMKVHEGYEPQWVNEEIERLKKMPNQAL